MRSRNVGARLGALVGSIGLVTALVVPGGVARAGAASPTSTRRERVIVVLADQLASTPASKAHISARASRATSAQDAVLARLAGPAPTRVTHFAVGNAFGATVTSDQAAALASDPAVASVAKDASVRFDSTPGPTPGATSASSSPAASASSGASTRPNDVGNPFTICPTDPAAPLVEPEALQSIDALTTDGSPNAQQLSTGAGVKVAYIADGIDPDNPDFVTPGGDHVIVDYQDFSGEGPNAPSEGGEAFGDASSIAAQGTVSYDLSDFVNQAHPLPPGCNIRILGVAPGAQIVALKAAGTFFTTSSVLQSIDYAVRVDHVDVLNESFGVTQFPDASSRNAIQLFNDQAVAAGVTLTVASGDGGVNGTIAGSAADPNVISVGATTDNRLYAQTTYAAEPFSNGRWTSDNISALSSGGVTQLGRTVDLVAPGEGNWAVCEPGFSSCLNFRSPAGPSDIQAFGGTSESAPLTAGVAALVISAYRSTHDGASPSPAVVKQIITGTATDLSVPPSEQGSGLLNARAATEAALTWPGATAAADPSVASNIVTSTDQMTLTGTPGSTKQGKFTVTNVGTDPQTVAAGTRAEQTLAESTQATEFDSTTLPTFTYYNGQNWADRKLTFHVPPGGSRLVAQVAWAGSRPSSTDATVRLTLLAPDGTLVANSLPQGGAASANEATVDVRNPAPGTWTAVLYSLGGSAGYTGVIGLAATTERAIAVGSVQPPVFTLNPGASQVVTTRFTVPTAATGDQTDAVTLASSDGHQTAVGAVVRTLIDTGSGHGTFNGIITGGNARPGAPGETLSYQFDVPKQTSQLDVDISFHHNPESVFDLVLIDPKGELSNVVSNLTPNRQGTVLSLKRGMQSFTADPLPGRWTLVAVAQNPVSGTYFTQSFRGDVSFDALPVDRAGLPDDVATVLAAGVPVTTTVSVTNPGVQPILVGADPRLMNTVTLQPVPIQGSSTFALPENGAQNPTYNVPPDTSSLTVAASSTVPAQLELLGSANGFDVLGDLAAAQAGGTISSATVSETGTRNFITKGLWFTGVQEIGPFTDAGQVAGSTTLTASMRTYAFDSDVTTSTGDPYGNSIDPNNNGFDRPIFLKPGQTKTIRVTITPSGAPGTVVSGVLNLVMPAAFPAGVTALPQFGTGAVIAALPYHYTIG
ncbi:MAG TPA: S8 family serine peptidase [Acidimicrobiia bacterium]|nr:S8 family serine peptidase [Acidimicrobiia bacterium]